MTGDKMEVGVGGVMEEMGLWSWSVRDVETAMAVDCHESLTSLDLEFGGSGGTRDRCYIFG
jgi:hypothetical protein